VGLHWRLTSPMSGDSKAAVVSKQSLPVPGPQPTTGLRCTPLPDILELLKTGICTPGKNDRVVVDEHSLVVRPEILATQPPVIFLHDFLTAGECKALIDVAEPRLQPSKQQDPTVANAKTLFANPDRTSYSAFLRKNADLKLEPDIVRIITARLSQFTGLGPAHVDLQVVRYEPKQQFVNHHDGAFRRWTFLLYLNDLLHADDGGETKFTTLNMTVRPRVGCAVAWRNNVPASPTADQALVLSEDNGIRRYQEDNRVLHCGLPPRRGLKYACNGWIHEEEHHGRSPPGAYTYPTLPPITHSPPPPPLVPPNGDTKMVVTA